MEWCLLDVRVVDLIVRIPGLVLDVDFYEGPSTRILLRGPVYEGLPTRWIPLPHSPHNPPTT